jgi:hypothetical protein
MIGRSCDDVDVAAFAAVQVVFVAGARDGVVARTARDGVNAAAADDGVVAGVAVDRVGLVRVTRQG